MLSSQKHATHYCCCCCLALLLLLLLLLLRCGGSTRAWSCAAQTPTCGTVVTRRGGASLAAKGGARLPPGSYDPKCNVMLMLWSGSPETMNE